MKKLLLLPICAILATMASCSLDADGNNAKSTQWYCGFLDSIVYTNDSDSIFATEIESALHADSICRYAFTESSQVAFSSMQAAMLQCDNLAIEHFQKLTATPTLMSIKKQIFAGNDSIAMQYKDYTNIPLHPFTVYVGLYSTSYYGSQYSNYIYNTSFSVK